MGFPVEHWKWAFLPYIGSSDCRKADAQFPMLGILRNFKTAEVLQVVTSVVQRVDPRNLRHSRGSDETLVVVQ